MKRRSLLIAAQVLLALPIAARAQPRKAPAIIGWLHSDSAEGGARNFAFFKEGLAAAGLKEGEHIVIEARWLRGRSAEVGALAAELAKLKSTVIVTAPNFVTVAVLKAVSGIPVVQMAGGSLVESGHAASLARPGGMVTGLVNLSADLIGKRVELLKELMPKLERIGFLVDPNAVGNRSYLGNAKQAASQLKLQASFAEAARVEELVNAFSRLKQEGVQALVPLPSSWFGPERNRITQLALEYRWPMAGGSTAIADAGGLLGYGFEVAYNYRRAAWYVEQILKGRKPGDLPIEQPSRFELAVNLKTAKALGITVPSTVMIRADRVIQ